MTRRLLLCLTILIGGAAALAQPKSNSIASISGNARAYAETTEFDFGFLPNDAFVSYPYKLRSVGQDSLKILSVKPGCGCTKAPLRKEIIAPGDSADIELVFHAAKAQTGRVEKSTIVTLNDPAKGTLNLRFRGQIYPNDRPDTLRPLAFSVSRINWMLNQNTEPVVIKVTNTSNQPLRLSVINNPVGFADVVFPADEIKPGKSRDIRVSLARELAVRDFQKSFTIECNDAAKTRYTIPILLDRLNDLPATPVSKTSGS